MKHPGLHLHPHLHPHPHPHPHLHAHAHAQEHPYAHPHATHGPGRVAKPLHLADHRHPARPAPQAGMAMVEALVASALLALGMLGATALTQRALDTATHNQQLQQAQVLALQTLQCAQAAATANDNTTACASDSTVQGVRYSVTLQTQVLAPSLIEFSASVQWQGRSGPQRLQWRSRQALLP